MFPKVGSQEEERREVGCQSYSVERKEAAVQVDLLTQQSSCRPCPGVCGGAWQCVSIKADEPGGGALFQRCSARQAEGQHLHHMLPLYLLCCPPRHPPLPTTPLSGPPAAALLQQTLSLPSMPLCEHLPLLSPAHLSTPPGLIAPLSPHLAQEEEEEAAQKEQDLVKTGTAEQGEMVRRTAGPPIRCLIESETTSQGLVLANHGEAGGAGMKTKPRVEHQREEEEEEEEERAEDGVKTVKLEEADQMCTVGSQVRHVDESHGLSAANQSKAREANSEMICQRLMKEPQEEDGDGGAVPEAMEKTKSPRRNVDIPPITHLEEQSHDLSRANHRKARGDKAKRRLLIEDQREKDGDDGVRREAGRPRRNTIVPPIRYWTESKEQSHDLSLANHRKERGDKAKRRLWSEHQEDDRLKEAQQAARSRRNTDDPPIRCLNESEEQSHDPSMANQSKTVILFREETKCQEEEDVVQPERTGQVGRPRRKAVGPPIRYLLESEEPSFGFTPANQSEAGRVRKMLLSQKRKYAEEEDEFVQPLKTTKTKLVGLEGRTWISRPIRSLTESEGRAHSLSPANGSRAGGTMRRQHQEACLEPDSKHQETRREERVDRTCSGSTNHITGSIRGEESQHRGVIQSKQRSSFPHGETSQHCKEREANAGQAAQQIQRTRPEGDKNKSMVEERRGRRCANKQTEEEEQAGRLRRKMVGPPIRYLLESEAWSHAHSVANHSKAKEDKGNQKLRWKHQEERVEGSRTGGGVGRSWQHQLSAPRGGGCFSSQQLHLHRGAKEVQDNDRHNNNNGSQQEEDTVPPAPTAAPEGTVWRLLYPTTRCRRKDAQRWRRCQARDAGRVRRCKKEEKQGGGDGSKDAVEKEQKKEVPEQPQRPRRTMVGPPIRYLLESEEASYAPPAANYSRVEAFQQGTGGASGDTSGMDRPKSSEQRDGQTGETGDVAGRQTGETGDVAGRQTGETGDVAGRQTGDAAGRQTGETGDAAGRQTGDVTCRQTGETSDVAGRQTGETGDAAGRQTGDAAGRQTGDAAGRQTGDAAGRQTGDAAGRQTGDAAGRQTGDAAGRQTGDAAGRQTGDATDRIAVVPVWFKYRKGVHRNVSSWFNYRATIKKRQDVERWRRWQERGGERGMMRKRSREEEGERSGRSSSQGKEVKEEVTEPQRPRRRMVGPPIRYLLESELSRDSLTANQDRKPQKKNKAGAGASGDATGRQTGHRTQGRRRGRGSQVAVVCPCCVRLQRL